MENEYVIDIGNSLIKIAKIKTHELFSFSKDDSCALSKFFGDLDYVTFYISSVNHEALNIILSLINKNETIKYFLLTSDVMKSVSKKRNYNINNIDILGSDLFADVIAGSDKKGSEIIVDLGTATKILVVDDKKNFMGGMIFPGIRTCSSALSSSTSLLDFHEVELPSELISLNTKNAINAGSIYGSALMIKEYIEQIKEKYKLKNLSVIITGGFSKLIMEAYEKLNINSGYVLDIYRTINGIKVAFDL